MNPPTAPVESLLEKYALDTDQKRKTNILKAVLTYNKSKGESLDELPVFGGEILDLSVIFVKITEGGAYKDEGMFTHDKILNAIKMIMNKRMLILFV